MEYNYELENSLGLTPEIGKEYENIPDDWTLTPEIIADLIGMSVVSVRRYCRDGKIPAYKFGRKFMVTGKDFKEFMGKSKVRSKSVRSMFYQ